MAGCSDGKGRRYEKGGIVAIVEGEAHAGLGLRGGLLGVQTQSHIDRLLMIGKIISGSPCLESMELKDCHGYRRIDVTSKSVKKLVLFEYYCGVESEEDIIDCIKINALYISSLTIKGELYLRELLLLNVSSLVEVDLKYSISYKEFVIFAEEIFRGLLESLGHVKHITFGDHCSELLSRLKAGSDTSDDD
ncbi:hypothetical protein Tco_1435881 [Tanacetum coccineum]